MGTRMRLARRGMAREASWSALRCAVLAVWRAAGGKAPFTVVHRSAVVLSVQFPRVAGVADDHEAREEWVCAAERLG